MIASLDRLCGGRFALGVGIGWSAEEFQALGLMFERRAQRTHEYIDVMRQLWSEEISNFAGEFVSFQGVRSYPKPAQGGRIPIIFGGESAPALRRVAEYGTGWFGFNLSPDEAAAKVQRLEAFLHNQGRELRDVELIASPYLRKVIPDDLKRYHAIGFSEIVLLMQIPDDESQVPKQIEQMAREWVEPAAKLG